MEEEREEGQTEEIEEKYKYDSKPFPVSLMTKLSTEKHSQSHASVVSFRGLNLPRFSSLSTANKKLGGTWELHYVVLPNTERYIHDLTLSSLLQVNLLMSELEFDDGPTAQREYNRLFWQANIV